MVELVLVALSSDKDTYVLQQMFSRGFSPTDMQHAVSFRPKHNNLCREGRCDGGSPGAEKRQRHADTEIDNQAKRGPEAVLSDIADLVLNPVIQWPTSHFGP